MKINVETGKRAAMNDIVEALEQSELHAVFCGKDKMNPIALVFEIDAEDTKVVIRQAEKIIKARLGKSVSFSGRAARQLAVLWLIPPEKLASEKNLKSEEDEWNIPFIFSKERTESQSTVLNRKTKPISVFPGNIDGIKLALKPISSEADSLQSEFTQRPGSFKQESQTLKRKKERYANSFYPSLSHRCEYAASCFQTGFSSRLRAIRLSIATRLRMIPYTMPACCFLINPRVVSAAARLLQDQFWKTAAI